MQETFINQNYLSDEECTMCNSSEEATLAMEICFRQNEPAIEQKITLFLCPECLEELPEQYFEELDFVEDLEEEVESA